VSLGTPPTPPLWAFAVSVVFVGWGWVGVGGGGGRECVLALRFSV
jgi:hypothetical protein